MKRLCIGLMFFFILNSIKTNAQALDENTFDFWVGHWEVCWINPDSSKVCGTNQVVRILNKKVLQEYFNDPDSNYEGISISVYNPTTKNWHQAWADSDGTYYNFEGEMVDGEPIFKTKLIEGKIIHRMVFKEIQDNSFIWIWEDSDNNGVSWNELWKINYKRI